MFAARHIFPFVCSTGGRESISGHPVLGSLAWLFAQSEMTQSAEFLRYTTKGIQSFVNRYVSAFLVEIGGQVM